MTKNAVAAMALALGWGAPACAADPKFPDPPAIIAALQDAATHQQTLDQIAKMPAQALAPLTEAAEDSGTPEAVHAELMKALRDVYARLEAARTKREKTLDKTWIAKNLVDQYNQMGKRDAKWDAAAVAALTTRLPTSAERFPLFDAAVKAGCNDPLIKSLYIYHGLNAHLIDGATNAKRLDAILDELDGIGYGFGARFYVHCRFASLINSTKWPLDPPTKVDLFSQFSKAIVIFPQYAFDKPSEEDIRSRADILARAAVACYPDDHKMAFEQIVPTVTTSVKNESISDAVAARLYLTMITHDPRALSDALSSEDKNWLDLAATAATAAWKADPLDINGPLLMLTISEDGQASPEVVDLWFERATLVDPGSYDAAIGKLDAMTNLSNRNDPRLLTDREDLIDFGRSCLTLGGPRSRAALVLRDMYDSEAEFMVEDPESLFTAPQTWTDLRAVYERLLSDPARMTDDKALCMQDRAQYLDWAFRCHQWQAFLDLDKQFGNDIDLKEFGGAKRRVFEVHYAAAYAAAAR